MRIIRPAQILKTLVFALAAIVLLFLTVVAVRVFFPTGVPNRNYQQEMLDLSYSITPDSEEAQRNADMLRRAMRVQEGIPGEVLATLPEETRIRPSDRGEGLVYLLLEPSEVIEALDEEGRADFDIARLQYELHVVRVGPLLEGLTPASPIAPMWELPKDNDAFLFYVLLTDITGLRVLMRWEAIRLHEAIKLKDVSGAREALSRLGAIHKATHPVPFAIGRLVGLAMQAQVLEILHEPLARGELSGEMASALLEVMREWKAQDPGPLPAFRGERISTLSFVQAIFDGDEDVLENLDQVTLQPVLLKLLASERAVVQRIESIFDGIEDAVARRDMKGLDDLQQILETPGGGMVGRVVELVLPGLSNWFRQEIAAEAFRDGVITMLALEACRAERGEYPETLDGLVPQFMSTLPPDPFAMNNALFGYRRLSSGEPAPVETEYLLWSVGSDGVDDGGVLDAASLMQRDDWEKYESPSYLLHMVMRNHEWGGDIPLNMSKEQFFEDLRDAGWRQPFSNGD